MQVTSIKQQAKAKDRYSIYINGVYTLSLSDGALLESGLAVGQELSAARLAELKQLSSEDKLYGRALRYAAMRRRSRWELEEYLRRKESPPALSEYILNKLTSIGLVDDMAFAVAWVENRPLLRPTAKRRLQQELHSKHVADEIIQRVLRDMDKSVNASADNTAAPGMTADQAAIRALIIRKRRQTKYQDNMKLAQYLARQGFRYEDIKAGLNSVGEGEE